VERGRFRAQGRALTRACLREKAWAARMVWDGPGAMVPRTRTNRRGPRGVREGQNPPRDARGPRRGPRAKGGARAEPQRALTDRARSALLPTLGRRGSRRENEAGK